MTTALVVFVIVMLALVGAGVAMIYRVVAGPPRRVPCPQCSASGNVGKKNALVKVRCPFCAGTREVWR